MLGLVLNPDDRDILLVRPVDQALHGADNLVAAERAVDDKVLQVDDQQRCVGAILECRHTHSVACVTCLGR